MSLPGGDHLDYQIADPLSSCSWRLRRVEPYQGCILLIANSDRTSWQPLSVLGFLARGSGYRRRYCLMIMDRGNNAGGMHDRVSLPSLLHTG